MPVEMYGHVSTITIFDADIEATEIFINRADEKFFPVPAAPDLYEVRLEVPPSREVELANVHDRVGNILTLTRGAGNTSPVFLPAGTRVLLFPAPEIIANMEAFWADYEPMPSGTINMWFGNVGDIPSGWALCDGNNGTPDLRDRYILAAGSVYTPHDNFGVEDWATEDGGQHSHGGLTDEHILTEAELPAHMHGRDFDDQVLLGASDLSGPNLVVKVPVSSGGAQTENTLPAGADDGHTHGIQQSTTHIHNIEGWDQPTYVLAYIMRL